MTILFKLGLDFKSQEEKLISSISGLKSIGNDIAACIFCACPTHLCNTVQDSMGEGEFYVSGQEEVKWWEQKKKERGHLKMNAIKSDF